MDLIMLSGVAFGAIGVVLARQFFNDGSIETFIGGAVGFAIGFVFMAVSKILDTKKVKK